MIYDISCQKELVTWGCYIEYFKLEGIDYEAKSTFVIKFIKFIIQF